MAAIIEAEKLSKSYRLSHQDAPYATLRESLARAIKGLFSRRTAGAQSRTETFWALRDVGFSIKAGERVGIIGRNGAGKSTLLKILSRITEPTAGRVRLRGRVASLLEVGTGFHPELTGRENVFLNGAILGMSRAEIRKKFDEIVAFADVERFLDTPVKRYSSGMYTRLAFSVAAHLEPEVLIVDEVLAVGDASFQRKCLGRMQEIGEEGRTVIFVSHQMNAVERLCGRVLTMNGGRLVDDSADVRKAVAGYLAGPATDATQWKSADVPADWPFKPDAFYVAEEDGRPLQQAHANDRPLYVIVEGVCRDADEGLQIGFALSTVEGDLLFWSCHNDGPEASWPKVGPGRHRFVGCIPARVLNEGDYFVEMIAALYFRKWLMQPGVNSPRIQFSISGGMSDSPYFIHRRPGILSPVLDWRHMNLDDGQGS